MKFFIVVYEAHSLQSLSLEAWNAVKVQFQFFQLFRILGKTPINYLSHSLFK